MQKGGKKDPKQPVLEGKALEDARQIILDLVEGRMKVIESEEPAEIITAVAPEPAVILKTAEKEESPVEIAENKPSDKKNEDVQSVEFKTSYNFFSASDDKKKTEAKKVEKPVAIASEKDRQTVLDMLDNGVPPEAEEKPETDETKFTPVVKNIIVPSEKKEKEIKPKKIAAESEPADNKLGDYISSLVENNEKRNEIAEKPGDKKVEKFEKKTSLFKKITNYFSRPGITLNPPEKPAPIIEIKQLAKEAVKIAEKKPDVKIKKAAAPKKPAKTQVKIQTEKLKSAKQAEEAQEELLDELENERELERKFALEEIDRESERQKEWLKSRKISRQAYRKEVEKEIRELYQKKKLKYEAGNPILDIVLYMLLFSVLLIPILLAFLFIY